MRGSRSTVGSAAATRSSPSPTSGTRRRYDEIVVSTLPETVLEVAARRAAGADRAKLTGAPVTHVVSQPPKPEVAAGPAPVHEKHGVMTPLSVLTWGDAERQP